jgi:hypothetical protein
LSVTCTLSVVFSWYTVFLHQLNWLPQYGWNIVESGDKHHNHPSIIKIKLIWFDWMIYFQTYNKTTSMVAYKSDSHIRETCRALNVLYVYDRSYEPYLIYWLFPLQLAFQRSSEKTTEIGKYYCREYITK